MVLISTSILVLSGCSHSIEDSIDKLAAVLNEEQTRRLRQLAKENAYAEDLQVREFASYLVEELVVG